LEFSLIELSNPRQCKFRRYKKRIAQQEHEAAEQLCRYDPGHNLNPVLFEAS